MRQFIYFSLTAIFMMFTLAACSKAPAQGESYTLYLVRHAEKVLDKSPDPALTAQGEARALRLADLIVEEVVAREEGVLDIYSSDYIRTRSTASPLARQLGIEVKLYDPSDLGALARKLTRLERSALIVGHSNTTPPLAEILGAKPGAPIVEATEYDRLYKITLRGEQIVTQEIIRF